MRWTTPDTSQYPRALTGRGDVDVGEMSSSLTTALADLGAPCALENVVVGTTTIRFELTASEGTMMRDFRKLDRADDLAYTLGAETVRIQAPIPGEHLVGVEVPRLERQPILLGDVVSAAHAPLIASLGMDGVGRPLGLDVASLPHLALAGTSGSGKSTLIHAMLCSLLSVSTPQELALVLVDVKMTELVAYDGLPHLYGPVITDPERAIDGLWWCVEEMEARYRAIHDAGCRDIASYNNSGVGNLPHCLIAVDELADLMMRSRGEVESAVVRLGQKGRACGMHLLLATQTPRVQVLSGLIRANLPARICLKTASALDSRIVIERNGAEDLLGRGDGLLDDGLSGSVRRFQAPWISPETVESIVDHWASQVSVEERAAA